jgi:NADPH:quinone reductase-like Zn-dependent oxidoreductase
MSALVLHLDLQRPSKSPHPKGESVLIWGGGSSIGFYAVQIAAQVRLYPQSKIEFIVLTYSGGI